MTAVFAMSAVMPASAQQAVSVGGGAAGIQGAASALPQLGGVLERAPNASFAVPAVTLHREGGSESASVPDANHPLVHALDLQLTGVRVSTFGGLNGHPYAESTAEIAGFHVGSTALAKYGFTALRTHCRWDVDGVSATTELRAPGRVYRPAANTVVFVEGVGDVWLNRQWRETLADGSQVISVAALSIDVAPGRPLVHGGMAATRVDLAFSSCDPNRIPFVTGGGAGTIRFGADPRG